MELEKATKEEVRQELEMKVRFNMKLLQKRRFCLLAIC